MFEYRRTARLTPFVLLVFYLCAQTPAQSNKIEEVKKEPEIQLSCSVSKAGKQELRVDISLRNRGEGDIYFTANPQHLHGGRMDYYRIIDLPNRNRIIVNSQLYPSPPFFTYADNRSVELKRLSPGEEYLDKALVKFPISETTPPYEDNRPFIKESELTEVKVSFGIFTDREAALWVGHKVYGKEKLLWENKGKTLLDIQKIATSNACLVPKS